MQQKVLNRAHIGQTVDAGRVLVWADFVPIGGERCVMTTPKPSQVHPVLTREVSLKLWVYEGRSGPQQGVWLGALKGPLSVYCVNMGSKRCINWKRWKGVQLPLIERGRCLVGRVRS